MRSLLLLTIAAGATCIIAAHAPPHCSKHTCEKLETEANKFLTVRHEGVAAKMAVTALSLWNLFSDFSIRNATKNMEKVLAEYGQSQKNLFTKFDEEKWLEKIPCLNDGSLKRRMEAVLHSRSGGIGLKVVMLTENDTKKMSDLLTKLRLKKKVGKHVKVEENTCMRLEDLKTNWAYKVSPGKGLKDVFLKYIAYSNKNAQLNGHNNRHDEIISRYGGKSMDTNFDDIYTRQVLPFYRKLRAYRLLQFEKVFKSKEYMFEYIGKESCVSEVPYTKFTSKTNEIEKNIIKMKPKEVVKFIDGIFSSLGFGKLPEKFYENSRFIQTKKYQLCHPTAFMIKRNDYRVAMCAKNMSMYHYGAIAVAVGHIHYFYSVNNQPEELRDAPNIGFQESMPEVINLWAMSPAVLKRAGLLSSSEISNEEEVNMLTRAALKSVITVGFIRFYTHSKYMSMVYNGSFTEKRMNCKYWNIRQLYEGLVPPVSRSDEDMDIVDETYPFYLDILELYRYMYASVTKFQLFEALCRKAGQYPRKKLFECDFYGSKEAGKAIRSLMEKGNSVDAPDLLLELTGSREVTAQPMLNYFKPLEDWLDQYLAGKDVSLHWDTTKDFCKDQ